MADQKSRGGKKQGAEGQAQGKRTATCALTAGSTAATWRRTPAAGSRISREAIRRVARGSERVEAPAEGRRLRDLLRETTRMDRFFERLAQTVTHWTGSTLATLLAFLSIIIWFAFGPFF